MRKVLLALALSLGLVLPTSVATKTVSADYPTQCNYTANQNVWVVFCHGIVVYPDGKQGIYRAWVNCYTVDYAHVVKVYGVWRYPGTYESRATCPYYNGYYNLTYSRGYETA